MEELHDLLGRASNYKKVKPRGLLEREAVAEIRTAYRHLLRECPNGYERQTMRSFFIDAILQQYNLTKKSRATIMNLLRGTGYPDAVANDGLYSEAIPMWENRLKDQLQNYIKLRESGQKITRVG